MSTVVVNKSLKTLHEALQLSIEAVKDAAVVADAVYRDQEKALFNSEGSSGGGRWTPLTREYKAWKDRQFSRATALISSIAKARGERLGGFAMRAAVGSDNKILQLTGDMRRAFSTQASSHVAEGFILPQGARIKLGAQGPGYFAVHAEGQGGAPKRDPQQRTTQQSFDLIEGVRRALIPHIMRAMRVMLQTGVPKT